MQVMSMHYGSVCAAIIGGKFGHLGYKLVSKGLAVLTLLITIPLFFTSLDSVVQ